jgi:hypothetical protein
MLGFAGFWLRFGARLGRTGDALSDNARAVLVTRIGMYLIVGICAILLVITKSHWFAWIGIAALVGKFVLAPRRTTRPGR